MYDNEIWSFPLPSTKNAHASLLESWTIWYLPVYTSFLYKFHWWKQCKQDPLFVQNIAFRISKQKPGRGTILLEILGISFNKRKHRQQKQFPSSFPSSSNNWPKLSLLERTNQQLQQSIDLKETGNYWCFPIFLNKWISEAKVWATVFFMQYYLISVSAGTRLSPKDFTYKRIRTQKKTETEVICLHSRGRRIFQIACMFCPPQITLGSGDRAQITPCWGSHYKAKELDLLLAFLAQWIF